jgi:hypothetical protein
MYFRLHLYQRTMLSAKRSLAGSVRQPGEMPATHSAVLLIHHQRRKTVSAIVDNRLRNTVRSMGFEVEMLERREVTEEGEEDGWERRERRELKLNEVRCDEVKPSVDRGWGSCAA